MIETEPEKNLIKRLKKVTESTYATFTSVGFGMLRK